MYLSKDALNLAKEPLALHCRHNFKPGAGWGVISNEKNQMTPFIFIKEYTKLSSRASRPTLWKKKMTHYTMRRVLKNYSVLCVISLTACF